MRDQQALLRRQLREILRELGYDSPESNAHRWVVERVEAVNILRQVCARFGDNEWPDNLHMGDVIEKHLWRSLEAKPYVPKVGDRVIMRYETWGPEAGKGGIAELPCVWVGVEPDPAPGFEPGEIVIGSPDLAD